MAVQRRVNFISQARVDIPDLRSIESSVSNDFDQLIQSFVTGPSQGYILRGFEILMTSAINGASSALQMIVDPGAVLHVSASQSGSVFQVPAGTPYQSLNGTINPNVNGSFIANAINYVGLDYTRFIDSSTAAQVYTWDPTSNSETATVAPRAQILTYSIVISTSPWTSNVLPIAMVTTNSGNNVVSITDCRWMLFRLGQGGATPNPFYTYPWAAQTEGRTENPVTSSNNSINPFHGGDKMLGNLKDWMNAMMSGIQEIKGTTYWYSSSSAGSIASLREDLGNTVVTSAGAIAHGVLPNTLPVLNTTGNTSTGFNTITSLASTAGITIGQFIMGNGIPPQTQVLNVIGTTVTMTESATFSFTGSSVSFFNPDQITAPGQVNWNKNLHLDVIGSNLKYKILPDMSNAPGNITLADNQVAYLNLVRGIAITPNLIFTNGSTAVSSVGSISWTSLLQAGDWIKLASDQDSNYYQIDSISSLYGVVLTLPFAGTSTGISGTQAVYAFGTYQTSPTVQASDRYVHIADRSLVPSGGNTWWFLLRQDNSGLANVYVRFTGQELAQGDTNLINDGVPRQLLQYIGSPMESVSTPAYVSAINPGAAVQVTSITVGDATTVSSNQYFLLFSSGSNREYYIWINKDGTGVDPAPLVGAVGLQWMVLTGQTASQLASTLAVVLNDTYFNDFSATALGSTVTVTNRSAGSAAASNFSVGAPFAISLTQTGTGVGNFVFQDGDNLTLAIKKLDQAIATLSLGANKPGYDELVAIVASGATPPTSLNGPISAFTNITLPNNSRLGNIPVYYEVGSGKMEVFLNGQKLIQNIDYTEVGITAAASNLVNISIGLVVGDELEFTFAGNGGGGGGGQQGPPGPQGIQGDPGANGHDAAGGPVAISTKNADYTATLTDNIFLVDCTVGAVTITLPAPASSTGHIWYCKKIDSSVNPMQIVVSDGSLIDGLIMQSSVLQYESFTLVTDGTSYWFI